jgi:AAA domain
MPETPSRVPWTAASRISATQGLCIGVYSLPGAGKTTLGATVTQSKGGAPLLVINFDGETQSISDRDDIMVWPGEETGGQVESWSAFTSFNRKLISRRAPFKSFMFDTLSNAYPFAYAHVLKGQGGQPSRDPRADFGKANDLLLSLITEWARLSRERKYNVIFNVHSEEKQDGENGPLKWRPSITPGVVKGLYARVPNVGFLLELPTGKRKLYLHNTAKITAKVHQPKNGGIPLEIENPDLGLIADHVLGIRPYPKPEKKAR